MSIEALTPHERLGHTLPGTEKLVRNAVDARRSLARVQHAQRPTSGYGTTEGALDCAASDCKALAAIGQAWPEEQQRLQLALENLVRAVKGDANRRLQLLQSYLAQLDEDLSAEDAAKMFDCLHAPESIVADPPVSSRHVIARRAKELHIEVQRIQNSKEAHAAISPAKHAESSTGHADDPPVSLQQLAPSRLAGIAAAGTAVFLCALLCFTALLEMHFVPSVILSTVAGGSAGIIALMITTRWTRRVAPPAAASLPTTRAGCLVAPMVPTELDEAAAELTASIDALSKCSFAVVGPPESAFSDFNAAPMTDPAEVRELLARDVAALSSLIAALAWQ